jgi:hypothetical protein
MKPILILLTLLLISFTAAAQRDTLELVEESGKFRLIHRSFNPDGSGTVQYGELMDTTQMAGFIQKQLEDIDKRLTKLDTDRAIIASHKRQLSRFIGREEKTQLPSNGTKE